MRSGRLLVGSCDTCTPGAVPPLKVVLHVSNSFHAVFFQPNNTNLRKSGLKFQSGSTSTSELRLDWPVFWEFILQSTCSLSLNGSHTVLLKTNNAPRDRTKKKPLRKENWYLLRILYFIREVIYKCQQLPQKAYQPRKIQTCKSKDPDRYGALVTVWRCEH